MKNVQVINQHQDGDSSDVLKEALRQWIELCLMQIEHERIEAIKVNEENYEA